MRLKPGALTMSTATFFGLGYSPVASGTVGTLGAVLVHYVFMRDLPLLTYFLVAAIVFEVACYVSHVVAEWRGEDDPGIIVIDEVVGYFVAMFAIPASPLFILGGFLIFRFFDIVKPWPASYFDKKMQNGLGIVMDDVAAGVYTCVVLHLIRLMAT